MCWELTGSLPPISHGLFLLPPVWALRGSWGDMGAVCAPGPQCPTGTMPAGPPSPRGATLEQGLAAIPCRRPPRRAGPEPSSSPVPAPAGVPRHPRQGGREKGARLFLPAQGSPRGCPQATVVWGRFGVAGGCAVGQWQSVVQPLPEQPAPAPLSHTGPPPPPAAARVALTPPREDDRVVCPSTH